ncbi:class I adenylate-forming enzyme family protein [Catellatospora sp. NPDC049111]|uniref:class I adenylate-forming enzyme family protein n=1 Tax=Catellatospora sp. NPDC049111 TaxID=3155271 RepID=UPI0034114376
MSATDSVHGLLDAAAARHPDRPAVMTTEASLSYGELAACSRRIAAVLHGRGVRTGDRVLLLGHNGHALVAAIHAVSRLGAAFVVVSTTVRPFQLRHMLADAGPAAVLADAEFHQLLAEAGNTAPVVTLVAAAGAAEADFPQAPADAGRTAALIYTSGSTAMPKAVVSTHANIGFATRAIQQRLQLRPDDVVGCFLPLAFDYGLYQVFLACSAGATLTLGTMADVGPGLLRRMHQWGVTVLPAVPSILSVLLSLLRRGPSGVPPLRALTNTGAHLPAGHVEQLRALLPGIAVYPMFGLTECKRVSILLPGETPARPDSVGRPLDGTRCEIVDEDGRVLPPHAVGQLVVYGPHVMAGYWRAPELTARRFGTGPGGEPALFTGDLCAMDEHGFLYFHGRQDDIYKHRGFRVSTVEVEAAALDIAGIDAAAVVPHGGDGPVLYVTGEHDAAHVLAQLRTRLDDYKVPVAVRVVEQLPVTGNGKVDRRALHEAGEPAR